MAKAGKAPKMANPKMISTGQPANKKPKPALTHGQKKVV
jgi:hypothetical protein